MRPRRASWTLDKGLWRSLGGSSSIHHCLWWLHHWRRSSGTPRVSPMFEQFSKFAVENLESLLSLINGYLFEIVWIMLGKRGFKKWTMGFVLVFYYYYYYYYYLKLI